MLILISLKLIQNRWPEINFGLNCEKSGLDEESNKNEYTFSEIEETEENEDDSEISFPDSVDLTWSDGWDITIYREGYMTYNVAENN